MASTPSDWRHATGTLLDRIKSGLLGRLATRTFLMFVICALVPIAVTGLITIRQTSSYLEEQAAQNMRMRAKSYGMQLFERLSLVVDLLRKTDGLQILADSSSASSHRIDTLGIFQQGQFNLIAGDSSHLPDRWNGPSPAALGEGNSTLWVQQDKARRNTVYMLYRPSGARNTGVLIAALNSDYLWQPVKESETYMVCVTDSRGISLHCSDADALDGIACSAGHTEATDCISADWTLFLGGMFGTADWRISTDQPKAVALAAVDFYKQLLLTAMLGTLALVALVSSISIRRNHRPLETLLAATRRIASGQFNESLRINSGDEYQELSEAFNVMGTRIALQFRTMAVLAKIDHLILESPSLEPVIESMLTQARDLLTCQLASIALFDTEAETLGRLYLVDDRLHDKPHLSRISWPITSVLQQGCDNDGHLVTRNSQGYAALQPLWSQGAQQCLLLPVMTRTRMNALLILGYRTTDDIESEQRQLARDLTDRLAVALTSVEREQALFQQAHYDSLTQLPNRFLFKDRLEQELAHARRDASSVALLFIDLDRFKHINDSLGHTAGDQLLKQAATRLADELRDIDTIARLGGDEFTIIVPQLRTTADISRLCERLQQRLSRAFVVDDHEFFVGASIGVALYPSNGNTAEALLRNADTAMYRAKNKARGSYAFYEESMNQEIQERTMIESLLRQALGRGELELYYQPKIDLATGDIVSAEALLRWNHPDHGMIEPARFIPIAEETGLIVPIGEWVIDTACAQLQAWRRQGITLKSISANVAVPQLQAPEFVPSVQRIMDKHQIGPGMLELEVTESTLAADIDKTAEVLHLLSSAGVYLAIDDFGTGYSSLSYLQCLPIDVLKIDRAFMPRKFDGKDHAICDAILAMARALGKTVVAEGIENAEQLLYLQSHGCHIGQGYFFGRAISSQEFTARMRNQKPPQTQAAIAI